ncbi:hypothetical protein D3C81_2196340 [compost metagenome]
MQPRFSLTCSAIIIALVSTIALVALALKVTTGVPIRCLVRTSDAPIRIEPSTKSLARPSNHVISMVPSG